MGRCGPKIVGIVLGTVGIVNRDGRIVSTIVKRLVVSIVVKLE